MVSFSSIFRLGKLSAWGAAASVALLTSEAAVAANMPAEPLVLAQALSDSRLGISAGQQALNDSEAAIDAQNYDLALSRLQSAREILNETSTSYQAVAAAFVGIDSEISSNLRTLARDAAQMRDQATLRQALVYRAQGQPALAVPLLVEVVQSQGPTRELGLDAYSQLFELGFVGRAYRRTGSEAPSASVANVSRPLTDSDSPIGIAAARILIDQSDADFAAGSYGQAVSRLQEARETLNTASGYYQKLFATFTGIDGRISGEVRQRALDAAELRDLATLKQAQAHQAQQQPSLAVPLLVEVLSSQNPTRELGRQAYEQLLAIGFVAQPYDQAEEAAAVESP